MREEVISTILHQLNGSSADIEASAVISIDGLVIASLLPKSIDEDRLGAMAAAMLSLGERTAEELARGDLEQVLIKGSKGYVLMAHAGEDTVICVIAKSTAKLGMVFLDVKRSAEAIAKTL
ncbi:MAG: hypothetical protein RIT27_445 [Pseudomonadota bacterium]|jgi:predicted regulator of Ras-like GTPase activity (Roadblock/LC7/MglB family)